MWRHEFTAQFRSIFSGDWRAIIVKAVSQAKHGDAVARKWLSDYLMGTPPQRHELTGSDGDPLAVQIIEVVKADTGGE